jgi:hypothetical protein
MEALKNNIKQLVSRKKKDMSNLYWLFFLFGASDSHAGRVYTVMHCACL